MVEVDVDVEMVILFVFVGNVFLGKNMSCWVVLKEAVQYQGVSFKKEVRASSHFFS